VPGAYAPDFNRLTLKDFLADLCVRFTQRTGRPGCPEAESLAGSFLRRGGFFRGHTVCVSDDGAGLKSEGVRSESAGLGMRIMRERAAAIGARVDFVSESGNGLMVRIEPPPPAQGPLKPCQLLSVITQTLRRPRAL
jgi:hypothetical protein